ncbi:coatomer subunit delta [Hylaeus anthracinus]|uniref:coatomer subunit delta n=1 Tax=Hylaeus volcanicus TaxID=313075 RepID=UPI0023B7812B|nr:coatomer subunit delta [Hylaeus volcanicus]XP_053999551.1 coatomer subunit delta [Hylaeus anthracinus]
MVLIAAAVCTKAGKTIISRQFVEMTKARIEGLLAAFPKLMSTGKQHTFVETESVRYVYQPLEKVYMLLITTKASNILEDLETLRLFARVIPEYCNSIDELEIAENAFNLIFAFDEIVALGYRESVNLAQIRTFVEMDSHEEKVYQAVRMTQEREARNKMREKAKELQRQRMEANKKSGLKNPGFGNAYGNSGNFTPTPSVGDTANFMPEPIRPLYTPTQKTANTGPGAMKLGGKSRDVDSFVDQLKEEGENVVSTPLPASGAKPTSIAPQITNTESVHLRQEERLNVRIGRDGGLQHFELHGLVTLHISDEKWGRIRVQLENNDARGIQLQTHPNVDKELFRSRGQIGLKIPTKPFPLNTDVGVLKWRLQAQDETALPISINCWPSENGEGGCDVNIEYELEQVNLELNDVQINIPLPMGCTPIVSECDGQYTHEARRNTLVWSLPIVDATAKSGSMEFSAPSSTPSNFFPLHISFSSKTSYVNIKVSEVLLVEDESPVKYSVETVFFTDNYEVV